MTRKNKSERRFSSLRAKMFLSFALFCVIVLAVLWLFQMVLLDDIYRALKLNSLEKCADQVYEAVMQSPSYDDFDDAAGELAKKHAVCFSIYDIQGTGRQKTGTCVMEKHVNSFCFIHNVRTGEMLNRLYREAKKSGGELTERVSLSEMFGGRGEDAGENVIFVRLVEKNGVELLILFNNELQPLDATVSTLRVQLIWISVILLLAAGILAFVLSGRISRPIAKMSEEASKLALGNYNVNFDGGNCTETVNLSATLNRAAYELSRLDKMQKDLIANVSHDLRTPLTLIGGYSEIMRDDPEEATPENMQIVIDETNRLTSLINDMLEVSKYQGGTQVLKITRFNFTDVIRTTLERYAKLREKDGYVIVFESDRDVWVDADEGRILQVIYNLINNAVNYTGEDKTVVIRQTVEVKDNRAHSVLLEVIDTGIGIPDEDLPLVWERYYKVNDFHKRANMGTGLGLSIVKNILLLHQANFGVRSQVGKGSCFWFRLNLADDAAQEETE
ncbi:MAG: two-component sensor histidine kinase [Clostridia bacterium]|nr:two-component sensor histidine kinase [Clostridia bacterium]